MSALPPKWHGADYAANLCCVNEAGAVRRGGTHPERIALERTACALCFRVHGDPAWLGDCPFHGHAYVFDPDPEVQAAGDDWEEHQVCPEPGCGQGRWTG